MLASGEAEEPCLTEDEVLTLARWALLLEKHFGGPQDIEWAKGRDHQITLGAVETSAPRVSLNL